MNQAESHPISEIVAATKRLAQKALDLGENRLELLMVEVQEARERLLHALLLALGAAVLGLLAGVALTAIVAVAFWESTPLIALGVLMLLYGGGALFFYRRLAELRQDWQTFSATIEQLRKDRACLANTPA